MWEEGGGVVKETKATRATGFGDYGMVKAAEGPYCLFSRKKRRGEVGRWRFTPFVLIFGGTGNESGVEVWGECCVRGG